MAIDRGGGESWVIVWRSCRNLKSLPPSKGLIPKYKIAGQILTAP